MGPSHLFGIVNLFKPAGVTSRDALSVLSTRMRRVKMGHAGTLDPLADGVLLVAVGRATRLISYLQELPKFYRATFELGLESPSFDIETPVSEVAVPEIEFDLLRQACGNFIGEIEQTPPVYSALKVEGRRAYKLARSGKAVSLQRRKVTIFNIRMVEFSERTFVLDIECSKGTYVRSLGHDIARSLGTSCVMTKLTRSAIGPFAAEDALTAETFLQGHWESQLINPARAFPGCESVTLTAELQKQAENGVHLEFDVGTDQIVAVDERGVLCAVMQRAQGRRFGYRVNFLPHA